MTRWASAVASKVIGWAVVRRIEAVSSTGSAGMPSSPLTGGVAGGPEAAEVAAALEAAAAVAVASAVA